MPAGIFIRKRIRLYPVGFSGSICRNLHRDSHMRIKQAAAFAKPGGWASPDDCRLDSTTAHRFSHLKGRKRTENACTGLGHSCDPVLLRWRLI
jgi:hypothetical protein